MWDNRADKRNPKAPDFRCRDRACCGAIWRGQHLAALQLFPPAEPRSSSGPASIDEILRRQGRAPLRKCYLEGTDFVLSEARNRYQAAGVTCSDATMAAIAATSWKRRRRRLTTVRLVRESTFPAPVGYPADDAPIRCPGDVFARMRPYAEREVEEAFWILPLDSLSRVCVPGPVVISRGILNSSLVHPREVFHAAIEAHAAGMILVHNHPSGDPTPSPEDRTVTRQLVMWVSFMTSRSMIT